MFKSEYQQIVGKMAKPRAELCRQLARLTEINDSISGAELELSQLAGQEIFASSEDKTMADIVADLARIEDRADSLRRMIEQFTRVGAAKFDDVMQLRVDILHGERLALAEHAKVYRQKYQEELSEASKELQKTLYQLTVLAGATEYLEAELRERGSGMRAWNQVRVEYVTEDLANAFDAQLYERMSLDASPKGLPPIRPFASPEIEESERQLADELRRTAGGLTAKTFAKAYFDRGALPNSPADERYRPGAMIRELSDLLKQQKASLDALRRRPVAINVAHPASDGGKAARISRMERAIARTEESIATWQEKIAAEAGHAG